MRSTADAIALFSSHDELARLMGVDRTTVTKWAAAGRIPTRRAAQLLPKLVTRPGFDAELFQDLMIAEAASPAGEAAA